MNLVIIIKENQIMVDIYGNTRTLPAHLQTAQTIIDSFHIISNQWIIWLNFEIQYFYCVSQVLLSYRRIHGKLTDNFYYLSFPFFFFYRIKTVHHINSKVSLYINMSQDINKNENKQGQDQQQQQQSSSQWSEMIGQVIEKITGKNMSTTMSFEHLEVDIPRAQGPGGRDLGSAKWTINGRIVWTTEAHKTEGDR